MINPHDLQRHYSDTSRICGIYFLFKGNDIVYIGQSVDIFSRMRTHRRVIDFDFFSFIWCEKEELNSTELNYIQFYKPILNKNYYVGKKYRPSIPNGEIKKSSFTITKEQLRIVREKRKSKCEPKSKTKQIDKIPYILRMDLKSPIFEVSKLK